MADSNISMSISNPHPANFNGTQKVGLSVTALGVLAIFLAWAGVGNEQPLIFLFIIVC